MRIVFDDEMMRRYMAVLLSLWLLVAIATNNSVRAYGAGIIATGFADDPSVLVAQAEGHAGRTQEAMQDVLTYTDSVQSTQNLDTIQRFDNLWHSVTNDVADTVNTVVKGVPNSGLLTSYVNTSPSYSTWQVAGYYTSFSPAQQAALQELQPILQQGDSTAYYRYNPTTGTVQIQTSSIIGQVRLAAVLANSGLNYHGYSEWTPSGQSTDTTNEYDGAPVITLGSASNDEYGVLGSLGTGVYGSKFGFLIQLPPNPPQAQGPQQAVSQQSGSWPAPPANPSVQLTH